MVPAFLFAFLAEPKELIGFDENYHRDAGILPRCTGDCNSDDDCLGDLKCFQRSYGGPVPGCTGNGAADTMDYCYGMPAILCSVNVACPHPLRVGGNRCSRSS